MLGQLFSKVFGGGQAGAGSQPSTSSESKYDVRLGRQRWTHIALHVKDIEASIAWYEAHTHLKFLDRHQDENGKGAWLSDPEDADSPFVLVLAEFFEGKDPFSPAVHHAMGPFAHIGIEMTDKSLVDEAAERGKQSGCLAHGPLQMPDPIGYVCFLKDPDGNTVEFSYDQGVYQSVKEKWG